MSPSEYDSERELIIEESYTGAFSEEQGIDETSLSGGGSILGESAQSRDPTLSEDSEIASQEERSLEKTDEEVHRSSEMQKAVPTSRRKDLSGSNSILL
jgi:hypothetical protein